MQGKSAKIPKRFQIHISSLILIPHQQHIAWIHAAQECTIILTTIVAFREPAVVILFFQALCKMFIVKGNFTGLNDEAGTSETIAHKDALPCYSVQIISGSKPR